VLLLINLYSITDRANNVEAMLMKRKPHLNYVKPWIEYLRFGLLGGRPYSTNCIQCYTLYVNRFLEEYHELSVPHLKSALLSVPVEQFAKREKIFVSLNCFAKFLILEKQLSANYLTQVKSFKPRRHLPPKKITVTQADIEHLIRHGKEPLERFLIILLSHTGLRASEACGLKLSDINLNHRYLTVRYAKWGKTRRVGLPSRVIEAINDYLPSRSGNGSEYLLLNRRGCQMDRHGIQQRIQRMGLEANIPVNPHALRRAFVTINANQGKPLVMLQMACGHNDIATTRSYCMTTEDEVVSAMADWSWT
jgi:site-specific recombinase XerD